MTAPVFVDTNVLLYAFDDADPHKQRVARSWYAQLWKERRGRVSYQVLQEFFANVCKKWPDGREQARAGIRDLLAWKPVTTDAAMLERGWKYQDRYRLSFWDALIVAAAKSASCGYLLTEDLQANQDIDGVLVTDPFRTDPASLR